ncbi:MAG: DNA replication and repair protein RecF [Gemmatimonadota bacterium]|nr:DNA replication and repair protein RecF [Gemmatimonadota bacterium]
MTGAAAPIGGDAPTAARLATLAVRDFRNLVAVNASVPDAGVVVVGENGHGKSNLLEAIAYLRLLRSVRGARDRDLIRHGAPAFHIAATCAGSPVRRVSVGVDRQGRKRVMLDGADAARLTDALDALPSVTFSPRDVDLVAGGPGERRRFLDITLALSAPAYLEALRQYRAALARRNAALRAAVRRGAAAAGVAAWEPALARHGGSLVRARRAWVAASAEPFAAHCAAIGERGRPTLRYAGAAAEADDPEAAIAEQLERQRETDVRRGLTQAGPHRDDLGMALDGHDLRTVGSAGQHRTAAIVLRLLEAATHRDATGVTPVLLLDDPFAELDRQRTTRILALLAALGPGQHLVCVPRADEVPAQYTRLARWTIADGTLTTGAA